MKFFVTSYLSQVSYSFQANIHSFLESDDRLALVLKYLDESISELDNMDGLVSSYKIHLDVSSKDHIANLNIDVLKSQTVSDDIQYIQSQNRGLQVQTQNQRALLQELENLLVLLLQCLTTDLPC